MIKGIVEFWDSRPVAEKIVIGVFAFMFLPGLCMMPFALLLVLFMPTPEPRGDGPRAAVTMSVEATETETAEEPVSASDKPTKKSIKDLTDEEKEAGKYRIKEGFVRPWFWSGNKATHILGLDITGRKPSWDADNWRSGNSLGKKIEAFVKKHDPEVTNVRVTWSKRVYVDDEDETKLVLYEYEGSSTYRYNEKTGEWKWWTR